MQDFNHIETLWATHTVDLKISADEMLKQAKKDVRAVRTKSLLNIGGLALSVLAMAVLWLFYDAQSWTTHIGITIMIAAIVVYTFMLYRNYTLISKIDFTANPNELIAKLKVYEVTRLSLHSRLYWFYVIALSLGMGFYFIEVLTYMQFWMQIVTIVLSFGWIIFVSTFVRKAVIKRDRERIAQIIAKFERIGGQLQATE